MGSSATPRTWHCIVTATPMAATTHHHARPPDHARHAPASAIALDSAIRFGFQMKVEFVDRGRRHGDHEPGHGSRHRPADRAGEPPHHPDRRHAGDRDERHDRERRIAPGQEGRRAQEVVVPGAVVDITDRGRRTQQRHDPVLDQRPQHQHVVALVAVPRPACREVREAQQGRQDEEPEQDEEVAPARSAADRGPGLGLGSDPACD